MSIQSYTVTRNVKAKDGAGRPVKIALASPAPVAAPIQPHRSPP